MTDRNKHAYVNDGKLKDGYEVGDMGLARRIQTTPWPAVPGNSTLLAGNIVSPAIATTDVKPLEHIELKLMPIEPKHDPAHSFLDEAVTVMKQRAALRDQPEGERSMATIVATFNALTGKNITEAEGWEFMILLKMVRGRQGNYHKDDYVDMSAYSGLLGECESKTRKK